MDTGQEFRAKLAQLQLRPTHRCFDDALDYLENRVRSGTRAVFTYKLVHGICLIPGEACVRFAHAWVDEGERIVQAFLMSGERVYIGFTHSDFEEIYRPQESTVYSLHQAWEMNERHATYGPWEPRYQALCHEKHPRMWDLNGKPVSE